ncbi:MAG: hypothetical protein GQ570_03155 [Helicobacteraceae bacterium]|nr:hypothetical protein [Helicobacteraceae bacterium]
MIVVINLAVAFFSSFIIILGSMYSYKMMISKRVESYEGSIDPDVIDKIEDPYDLYSEQEVIEDDEKLDLKAVIKEEKARSKGISKREVLKSSTANVSLFRVVPYAFLVLGFIGLNNNKVLSLPPYLGGLFVGIVAGFYVGKKFFSKRVS